jgi:hypothetical protein
VPPAEIDDGVSLDFGTSRKGCLRLDGRLYRTPPAHMDGHAKMLRLTDPVRHLATTRRAIERIAPDRLKRDGANCTGEMLYAVMAPIVPRVAVLTKPAGIYAEPSAFDAVALALAALTVPHVTIAAKAMGVHARRFAFDAKALAGAIVDKRGGFEYPLLICKSRSRTPLIVVPHIASPTQTLNEIGVGYATPWTFDP